MNKNNMLSIVIPARSEMFLKNTVEDILKNKRGDTEIIVVLDGKWSDPPLTQHKDVNIIYIPEAIGQRAATNVGVKLSKARYVMKVDAHCSFDKGFDRKMLEAFKEVGDDVTLVPIMRNLWAFDWKCYKCGWKKYQGPTPEKCPDCGRTDSIHRKMLWIGKERPQSTSYCFDSEPHFQYFREYGKRPEIRKQAAETGFTETMSLQGSCFMATREKYWELKLCDEEFGSWGNQGIEVALKTRLSGGKVLVCHKTWYSHMFRTQGGDFSFPYPQGGRDVQKTKQNVKNQLWNNWDKAIYPLSSVIDQFKPIPGWTDDAIKKLKEDEITIERSGIYSIKSITNNRIYIGSSINLSDRISGHIKDLKQNKHYNIHLQNTWNKYGENDLEFNILYFCKNEDLISNEQRFIDEYTEKIGWDNMFNISPTAGSSLGCECSEDTKEKISIAQTGKTAWNKNLTKETDERVRRYGEKQKGVPRWQDKEHPRGMLNKKQNKDAKQKIGDAQRGIPKTKEHNKKNSEAHKNNIFTEEHCKNLSIAQKNNPQLKDKKTGRFISRKN